MTPFLCFVFLYLLLAGPNTQSVDALEKLFLAGVDIVRMNFSHGSHEVRFVTFAQDAHFGRLLYCLVAWLELIT